MVLNGAGIFLVASMVVFMLTIGVLLFFLYDKGRFMIVGHDLATGDVVYRKARSTDQGIPWNHRRYENAYIQPEGEVGTWHGPLYSRPMVAINARTGKVLKRKTTTYNEDRDAVEGVLQEVSWPQLHWQLMDSGAVKQALETQKSFWSTHVGALLVSNVILGFGLVAIILMFGGNL